jgi:two-component system, NarL family, response regulator DesR
MVRVLIAEDMRILRDTLVAVLNLEDDIKVVAEVASGDRIVPAAVEHHPDVAVLDIDLPAVDGLTAAAELHRQLPSCRILVLTGLGQPGHLRRAVAAHVSGFMVKDAPSEELVAAVRKVAGGGRVFDPKLAVAALETADAPVGQGGRGPQRQTDGASADEIAADLLLPTGPYATTWRRRDHAGRPQPRGRRPHRPRGRLAVVGGSERPCRPARAMCILHLRDGAICTVTSCRRHWPRCPPGSRLG